MDYLRHYLSPLGPMTMAADGERLTGLWFDGQAHFTHTLSPVHIEAELPVFGEAAAWLDRYFAGEAPGPVPPVHFRGTAFQISVWELLKTIPYGKAVTYGHLAEALHSSARAVGGAVGRNPISILVPCHRVIGAGGRLTGYAGGLDRKIALLRLEGADIPNL